jgi:hypothetical protein
MFTALEGFDTLSTKDKLFALLDIAEQIVEHDVKIDGLTLDDCELDNADAEDAFEELRSALRTASNVVDYYVD